MNALYSNGKSAPSDRQSAGPRDVSEVTEVSPYLDFGSLRVPTFEGLQMRLDVEEGSNRVVAITLERNGSTIQLQAFAAPKSEGIWHEIRATMAQSIAAQGGTTEERIGSLGPELLARIPLMDESGNQAGFRAARFVGVDGPKWFLRGVVGGAAINDPKAAADIDDIFRSVTVVRGDAPMPPKDLLPLTMPGGTVTPPRVI